MNETALFDQEAEILRYVLRLALGRQEGSAWYDLEGTGALFVASATFFLLDVHSEWDVERFSVHTLRGLLQGLSRRTEQLQVEYQGRVRGRIAWPATYKARYGQDFDPSRYVCREVRHQYDTPENQLLKYLAERIDGCLKAVPAVLRSGVCYFSLSEVDRPRMTAVRLGDIEAAISQFRRNVYMREVTLPQEITDIHLVRARTAKMDEYRTVAEFYDRYQKVVATPSYKRITEIGKRMIPLPSRTGIDADRWLKLGADILSGYQKLGTTDRT
jgi:hypothetical protein